MKNKAGIVWIGMAVFVVLYLFFAINSMEENEYEKAGRTFGTWVNTDPRTWTDTQTEYFNDVFDWNDN